MTKKTIAQVQNEILGHVARGMRSFDDREAAHPGPNREARRQQHGGELIDEIVRMAPWRAVAATTGQPGVEELMQQVYRAISDNRLDDLVPLKQQLHATPGGADALAAFLERIRQGA